MIVGIDPHSGAMRRLVAVLVIASMLAVSAAPVATAQIGQPDIIQEHWYHSYATLTLDVNAWADEYPEIVNLLIVGQTEMGRNLWMLQISDWSQETKTDGTAKDVVYIDGGHHGNEHLGTELAFLVAEFYIEGWADGEQEVLDVLATTELHILIMLNADGNDFDTRWNVNQVDLNRNYDHYWNTCPTTQPGSSAFSESETHANSIYMNEVVPHADLYITMHTGVWIMLYPWGKWPEQPSDWELFHFIRDDVHANISDIPIRNANQGLYPNCGTSRDYGYGVMGYPTFTFETDDEQFLLGSIEAVSDRLGEELDVMRYLIQNVWYWRARLVVESIEIKGDDVEVHVVNLGRASTTNATLHYSDSNGELLWHSSLFGVNSTNETKVTLDGRNLTLVEGGNWSIHYQKRVIDASQWVEENFNESVVKVSASSGGLLPAPSLFIHLFSVITAAFASRRKTIDIRQN
ncbi:MAG: M14 family metallopeptidase [Candidatus Thermoplasmatota archaeon]|nr:M14 family metallopeptidase [Candidatus Thermoplasmatota archaeon]